MMGALSVPIGEYTPIEGANGPFGSFPYVMMSKWFNPADIMFSIRSSGSAT